ncbi:hypothetical protein FB451DRAFT_789200 [Mycena latifolia]|nr:hypothetical protein FB451DRAFT_789200 [Mycena latifolia]
MYSRGWACFAAHWVRSMTASGPSALWLDDASAMDPQRRWGGTLAHSLRRMLQPPLRHGIPATQPRSRACTIQGQAQRTPRTARSSGSRPTCLRCALSGLSVLAWRGSCSNRRQHAAALRHRDLGGIKGSGIGSACRVPRTRLHRPGFRFQSRMLGLWMPSGPPSVTLPAGVGMPSSRTRCAAYPARPPCPRVFRPLTSMSAASLLGEGPSRARYTYRSRFLT